jgi:phospholipid/cholesterol/gamma-HCH transport system substrate-binding protein
MTIKNKRSVIVGIFVLLGIAILIVTIFTLGAQKKTFVKSFTLNAVFSNVAGLLKGSNIWLFGVKVGTVKKISFYGDAQVLVTMSIELDAEPHIHKGAFAKISSDGLIGNKIIVIYGGDSTSPIIEKNDFLVVEQSISTDDMLATLQRTNQNLLAITTDFKSISKKIDSGKGTIAKLINDATMADKIGSTIDHLQTTMGNLNAASVDSKLVLANLTHFTAKLNTPGNSVNDLVSDTAFYNNIKITLTQLQSSAKNVVQLTANLQATTSKLNQQNNPVGVLLNDSSAANNLKTTLKNLESSTQKLDEDLEALQHNFLLRGFFRKKEKAAKEASKP